MWKVAEGGLRCWPSVLLPWPRMSPLVSAVQFSVVNITPSENLEARVPTLLSLGTRATVFTKFKTCSNVALPLEEEICFTILPLFLVKLWHPVIILPFLFYLSVNV